MKDLLTKLTFALGHQMAKNETNTLNESKDKKNWKYDVVIQFITLNINKTDVYNKTIELSKDLGLEYDNKYWKEIISTLKTDFAKDDKLKKATKTVKASTEEYDSYGCGRSSSSYGCGGGYSHRSYSSSYGCGGSSRNYGC